MIKKTAAALLIGCLVLMSSVAAAASENLIQNGDFSKNDEDIPENWETDAWVDDFENTSFYIEQENGNNFVVIESQVENDCAFLQSVKVQPNTLYRLSGMILAKDIIEGEKGANISAKNILATSESLYDTDGQWIKAELYGRTGTDQNTMTVMLRLGGYGSLNTGYAAFDDIVLEKVDSLPAGVSAASFMPQDMGQKPADAASKPSGWENSVSLWLVIGVLFFAISWGLYSVLIKKDRSIRHEKLMVIFCALLILSFILRLILAVFSKGHPTDITCFTSWSTSAASSGILNFYDSVSFADYPPGYMYALYIIGLFSKAVGLPAVPAVLVKLAARLCDIAIALMIFLLGRKRLGKLPAAALALLFAYLPVVLYNSAVWGQIDSILMLVIIGSLLTFINKKYAATGILFALAVLMKPQALMIGPLALAALIVEFRAAKPGKALLNLGICLGSFAAVFIAGVLPFCLHYNDPFWFAAKYGGTMSSYQYGTVNAFNFMYLLGGNWQDMTKTTDPLGQPLGISYEITGIIFIAATLVYTLVLYIKAHQRHHIFHIAALVYAMIFTFGPMMHERYILPAVFLLVIAYVYLQDWKLLFIAGGFALTSMINMAYVEQLGQISGSIMPMILSLINVALSAALAYISFDHAFWRKHFTTTLPIKEARE
jgi:dolichyl-phosphate-mannose-protein mannosyltransferase